MGVSTKPNVRVTVSEDVGQLISTKRRQVQFMIPVWVYKAFKRRALASDIAKPTDAMAQVLEQVAAQWCAEEDDE